VASAVGSWIVDRARQEARSAACEWLHVDYQSHLAGFYAACGFSPIDAGVQSLC